MAGIYVHIPFCKQACHYCDFHFSTNYRNVNQLTEAILQEIRLQQNFFDSAEVSTLYFGGGTPSSIPLDHLQQIIDAVKSSFNVATDLEITLEANPDDLQEVAIQNWKKLGVNRLSIGVQSFFDTHLRWMNRAHNQQQALQGIKTAQQAGITNITMDLIYGIPDMTMEQWEHNVRQFFELGIPHLSAYGLTIEPQTHLGHLAQKHGFNPASDAEYNAQFNYLMQAAKVNGFDHYEISNFALPNHYSKHNTAYWFGAPYLGIGPSAHSYKNDKRYWNIDSNVKYIKLLNQNELAQDFEQLTTEDAFNEYVLTRLRTMWGIDLNQIKNTFGQQFQNNVISLIEPYLKNGDVMKSGESLVLTDIGKHIADKIAADLFWAD